MVTVEQGAATASARPSGRAARQTRAPGPGPRTPFQPMDARRALRYKHPEGAFVDYEVQPLLPYEPSRHGPTIAVADANGDGLDDVFIGGAAGVPGKLFLQRRDGSLFESPQGQPLAGDKEDEDLGSLFFHPQGGRPPHL